MSKQSLTSTGSFVFSQGKQITPPPPPPPPPSPPSFVIAELPEDHPLEPNSCAIDWNKVSLAIIEQNIKECCRRLSLQQLHLSPEGQTFTSWLSEEYVWFIICIWKTGVTEVTVEIQRRGGDHYKFQIYAHQLYEAARGESLPDISHKIMDAIPTEARHVELPTRGIPIDPNSTLWMVFDSLLGNKNGLDCRQSGLEMLVVLSNPQKTNKDVSILICRVILTGATAPGTDSSKEARELQALLLDIILNRQTKGAVPTQKEDEDDDEFDEEWNSTAVFHSPNASLSVMLAVRVLENCLEVCSFYEPFQSDSAALIDNFLKHVKDSTKKSLTFTLMADIGKAEENAHIACAAAGCVRHICKISKVALPDIIRLGAKNTVTKAHVIGKSSHVKLEWACEQLLQVLAN